MGKRDLEWSETLCDENLLLEPHDARAWALGTGDLDSGLYLLLHDIEQANVLICKIEFKFA
jgi:hypothetical protein